MYISLSHTVLYISSVRQCATLCCRVSQRVAVRCMYQGRWLLNHRTKYVSKETRVPNMCQKHIPIAPTMCFKRLVHAKEGAMDMCFCLYTSLETRMYKFHERDVYMCVSRDLYRQKHIPIAPNMSCTRKSTYPSHPICVVSHPICVSRDLYMQKRLSLT